MKNKHIYILKGKTGAYEETEYYNFCYFNNEVEAEQVLKQCREGIEYLELRRDTFLQRLNKVNDWTFYDEKVIKRYFKKLGINVSIDSYGLWLGIEEIPIFRHSDIMRLLNLKNKENR